MRELLVWKPPRLNTVEDCDDENDNSQAKPTDVQGLFTSLISGRVACDPVSYDIPSLRTDDLLGLNPSFGGSAHDLKLVESQGRGVV